VQNIDQPFALVFLAEKVYASMPHMYLFSVRCRSINVSAVDIACHTGLIPHIVRRESRSTRMSLYYKRCKSAVDAYTLCFKPIAENLWNMMHHPHQIIGHIS